MAIIPQTSGVSESPEIAKAKRLEEKRNAKIDAEYQNPDFVARKKAENLANSPYGEYKPKIERHDDTFYDAKSPEGEVYSRIAERSLEWGNPELLSTELFSVEAQEQNRKTSYELFYNPEALQSQFAVVGNETPDINNTLNEDWYQANILKEGAPLQVSFERITGNLVLPERLQGMSLQDIHSQNPEDSYLVNDALADAYLIEIYTHTLKSRVNYPEEKVASLIKEIQSSKTSAFKKLKIFGEIHTLANTGAGKGGKKQSEAFRKRQAEKTEARAQEKTFQNEQVKKIEKNRSKPQVEETPKDEKIQNGGDIFSIASDIDMAGEGTKTTTKTA